MERNKADDGLGEYLAKLVKEPSQRPYFDYQRRMLEITADGLAGNLTEDAVNVESDFAYAQLQDETLRDCSAFRDAVVTLLRVAVSTRMNADEIRSQMDSLVLKLAA